MARKVRAKPKKPKKTKTVEVGTGPNQAVDPLILTKQLVSMAENTAKTGSLFKEQAEQLKFLGLVALNHMPAKSWEVWVDPEKQLVTYNLLKTVKYPKDLPKKVVWLEKSVQHLFQTFSNPSPWTLKIECESEVLYLTRSND